MEATGFFVTTKITGKQHGSEEINAHRNHRIPTFSLAHRQKRKSVAPGKLTFTVISFVPCLMIYILVEHRSVLWIFCPALPQFSLTAYFSQHSYIKSLLGTLVTRIAYNKATQTKPKTEKKVNLPKTKYKHNLINLHSRVTAANSPRLEDWVHSTQGLREKGKTLLKVSPKSSQDSYDWPFVLVSRNNSPW